MPNWELGYLSSKTHNLLGKTHRQNFYNKVKWRCERMKEDLKERMKETLQKFGGMIDHE